jgi:hypothetical protein
VILLGFCVGSLQQLIEMGQRPLYTNKENGPIAIGPFSKIAGLLICVGLRVLLVEFFHSAREGDLALFTGVERMTGRASFNTEFRLGRAGLKLVAAHAVDSYFVQFWMNVRFHNLSLLEPATNQNCLRLVHVQELNSILKSTIKQDFVLVCDTQSGV